MFKRRRSRAGFRRGRIMSRRRRTRVPRFLHRGRAGTRL